MSVAIIMGCNYAGVNTLPGAENSANGLTKLLRSRGFNVKHELLGANCTKANIFSVITDGYAAATGMGTPLVLYYIGHGTRVQIAGSVTDCLFPYDAMNDPDQVITAAQINALLGRRPSHAHTLWVPDCCYGGGALARDQVARMDEITHMAREVPWFVDTVTDFGNIPHSNNGPLRMQAANSTSNLLEWAPCGPTQLSIERQEGGHWYSLFTYLLLRAMQDPHDAGFSYNQMFALLKAQAVQQYAQATPEQIGDPALLAHKFLT